ncbi:MAG: hypothetical protein HGB11_15470, partial [Chlorobiales bacterium]|nr:hypothetical protein [Chlorobiales bacterium]
VSEKLDSTLSRKEIQTDSKGHSSFTPKLLEAGLYFIRAIGKDDRGNTARSETYAYVYGDSYVAWERFDDDRIEITPNKKSYNPGETASILIQSPYETSTALMTIEREGVIEHRVFELKGTAPAIQVPIKEDYLPNVYVSVMLFKGRTAPPNLTTSDLGKPSFRIGYAKLSVDPGQKHLQVEIAPNKTTYQTGEFVSAELRVKDSQGKPVIGEIALAAVDAGVLNLIGYELPDLFETFYQERPLGVTTSESLLHLIEQRSYGEKGESRGGGGGQGAGGLLFRQKFVATAYWNPSIITDANGKATVRFRLPDNLTTFRLMASAQSADASFGVTHTDIVVNKPLSLLAALPRFSRIGDKFEAGVVVHNYTKAPASIIVSQSATGIKSEGEQSLTISLEAGASKEVRFKFEAQTEGTASFSFVAKGSNGYSDAMKVSIPIYTPYTKETLALFSSTGDMVSETVKIPKTIYPGLGEISAQASSTALVGLRECASYLFDYPYGCLEQKASSVLPYILADNLIRAYALKTSADTVKGGTKAVVENTLADFE